MTREALLDLMWTRIEPDVFIGRAEWERGMDGWDIAPVHAGGALAFITATRGPEFHYVSLDAGAPVSVKLLRALFQPLLDRHGCVVTRTAADDARQRRFNERIGFRMTGRDEFFVHYQMDTPAWEKRTPCL